MSNESKCRDCAETLVWDDKNLTANGKKYPVEKNGNRHNCPFSKFNKSQDKSLGDRTPMEALSYLMSENTMLKKRIDTLEIEQRWVGGKTGTVKAEPKVKAGEIDWDKIRAKAEVVPESDNRPKSEDGWEKFKT